MTEGFIPLSQCLPFWPAELLGDAPALDLVGVSDFQMTYIEEQEISFSMDVMYLEDLELTIPGLDALSFVFLGDGGATSVPLNLEMYPGQSIEVPNLSFTARLNSDLLSPYKEVGGEWEPDLDADGKPRPVEFDLDGVGVNFDFEDGMDIVMPNGAPQINVDPIGIGDTGIVLELTNVQPFLNGQGAAPAGQAPGFRGLFIEEALVHLPGKLSDIVPSNLAFQNCAIGPGGFSGSLTANWAQPFEGDLLGMNFGLSSLSIVIEQNSLAEFAIAGEMTLPFFEETIDIEIGIDLDGGITIGLASDNGLVNVSKPNVLDLSISGMALEIEDGDLTVSLSGNLQPLIGDLDWPEFEVQELSIDSKGNIHLDGGWLNFPDQYTLDLHGFQLEISQLGFGRNDDGSKWIGFSGGLKLVAGIQAGASVEGLRITWFENDLANAKVSFDGVGVEFEVAEVVKFKGFVSFREFEQALQGGGSETVRRFDGEIKLEITAINLEIDAKLVIGTADGDEGRYRFFAVFLGVELPAGIPLWTTGLALYGMAGLFSWKMEPDKLPDEAWYGIGEGEGWYKRPEIGVTDLKNKWINRPDSLGLGAGVTIGTLPDNGFLFSTKLLFAIIFPGPIILFEGKANFLKERSKLDEEPIFRSLMVLDAREGTMQFGLDMEYNFGSGGELVEAGGSAEAFFNFLDPMAWHLYLGEKEPRDKRIRAKIFQLFEANTYLMSDAYKLQFGSWVGYDADWKFGPLGLSLEAWMEYNVALSRDPAYLYGDIQVQGGLELSVFRFSIGFHLGAKLAAQVFDPFFIHGEFTAGINLPWPLPDFEVDVSVEWGPKKDVPAISSPLKEVSIDHQKVTTSWTSEIVSGPQPGNEIRPNGMGEELAPVVPLDARPTITFNKSVHDNKPYGSNPPAINPEFEIIGDPEQNEGPMRVKYSLDNVLFQKWNGHQYLNAVDFDETFGSWAAMPKMGAGEPGGEPPMAATKLWLYVKNPFEYTRQISQMWEDWVDETYENYPCPPAPEDEIQCYDFAHLEPGEFFDGLVYRHPKSPPIFIHRLSPVNQSVRVLPAPIHGYSKALCFPSANVQPGGVVGMNNVFITFNSPVRRAQIVLDGPSSGVFVEARDTNGVVLGSPIHSGIPGNQIVVFEATENEIASIHFQPMSQEFCLMAVCINVAPPQKETDAYSDLLIHMQDEMARWADEGAIFEPYSNYRLRIRTSYETEGVGDFAGDPDFTLQGDFEDYIYFRTEGPPGMAALSPSNDPAAAESGEGTGAALENLDLYVKQTVPSTVPATGEKPLLPKPVYRGYDIGVEFNEDYVDLMYRIAHRDLAIHLFDNNDRPVRDAKGRLIVLSNQWGKAETASLSASSIRYVQMLNQADCLTFDEGYIPGDSTLSAIHKYLVLGPDTLHEARLVPLLFQEDFSENNDQWFVVDEGTDSGPSNWERRGHAGKSGEGVSQAGNVLTLNDNPDISDLDTNFDVIVLDRDTARPDKTYRVLAFDHAASEVTLDGSPSLSNTNTTWEIPSLGGMVQTSNIFGPPTSASNPQKPGTMLLLGDHEDLDAGHHEQPSNWTDFRITCVMRNPDNDGMGLVFRYSEVNGQSSYYRFAMNAERTYRRLVRVVNGSHTTLAEDDFAFETDIDYVITVEAVGNEIRIFQNGEMVFAVEDGAISTGTTGMYSWASEQVRFNEIRVEDFSEHATIAYAFEFTSSNFANFYHHLHSFQDERWELETGTDFSNARSAAQPSNKQTSEDEFRAYDALAEELAGGAEEVVPEVQVQGLFQSGDAIGWWLQSPEPILWDRVEINLQHSDLQLHDQKFPEWAKVTGLQFGSAIPNEEHVDVLLRDARSVDNLRLQYPQFDSLAYTEAVKRSFEAGTRNKGVLFRDDFANGNLGDWMFFDEGQSSGPSVWLTNGDALVQSSNIHDGNSTLSLEKRGTVAIAGDSDWKNLLLRATLRSDDNDEVGLVFRYVNGDNHYRFIMNRQASRRRLLKVEDGVFSLLWQDEFQYQMGEEYDISILLEEDEIRVYLGGALICAASDSTHELGQIGLFSWANQGAWFSDVVVMSTSVLQDLRLFEDRFEEAYTYRWEVFDAGTIQAPSDWRNVENGIAQLSNISSNGISRPGTQLISLNDFDGDFRYTARLETTDNDGMGIVLRYQDEQNFYRFTINANAPSRRFERFSNGGFSVLWQDSEPYSENFAQVLTIDAVGDRFTGYHNGVELFSLTDGTHSTGKIGLYAYQNDGLTVNEVLVEAPDWLTWYKFEDEGKYADGTLFRIYAGKEEDALEEDVNLEQRYRTPWSGSGSLTFLDNTQQLRLVNDDYQSLHQMGFLQESSFSTVGIRVLRKRDGSGVFVFRSSGEFDPGTHRMDLTFRRNNKAIDEDSQVWRQTGDDGDEMASIVIPWKGNLDG